MDLSIAYSEQHQSFIAIDSRFASYRSLYDDLLQDDIPYFLTNHLPTDYSWAAPIAQDAIAVIVNADFDVHALTTEQLRAIYQGRITRWNEIGGKNQPIIVYSREDGSGTRLEFERMVIGRRPITPNARVAISSTRMIEAIAENENSIGYVSLAYLDRSVQAVTLDGVYPTQSNVFGNLYPLRSTIYIVGKSEPEGVYREFVGWIQSPVGQEIVAKRYTPLIDILGGQD
jgi:phosphate transport system substrate-binding protein